MSALAPVRGGATRVAGLATQPGPRAAERPRLEVVAPAAATRGRVAFVVLVGSILVGGLVSLLLLHTLAAQDAFTVHQLQRHAATLTELEQQLSVADQKAQAPSALAAQARSLGLVPASGVRFVHRHDGTVVAVATAAPPPPVVVATPTPAASPSAAASASASPSAGTASKAKQQVKTKPTPAVHRHARHHG